MMLDLATPSGFRDVLVQEAKEREKITHKVQSLFSARGYEPIETPTLEAMDVMGAAFRLPATPFRFFDAQGELLAMRPDVTIQIARMCATRLRQDEGPFRFRYTQRVFRENDHVNVADSREMTQIGIECIGEAGPFCDAEIISLFIEAVQAAGVSDVSLSLATVGLLRSLLEKASGDDAWRKAVLDAYHDSDFVRLDGLCRQVGEDCRCTRLEDQAGRDAVDPEYASAIRLLARIKGGRDAIERARKLVSPLGCAGCLDDFEHTFDLLSDAGKTEMILVDFSVMSSFDYYTGMVFEAYSPRIGTPLGSGGRYDRMLGSFGAENPAAGFAFYLEQVMTASSAEEKNPPVRYARNDPASAVCDKKRVEWMQENGSGKAVDEKAVDEKTPDFFNRVNVCEDRPLRIAVPKGSLYPDSVACLQAIGFDTAGLDDPGRHLFIENEGIGFIIARPSDIPAFVAYGAVDCGICGKDSLLEAALDVVELVDLKFGRCRFVVAEDACSSKDIEEHYRKLGSIRVATKYPRITRDYYNKSGIQAEIVRLHGNIELAPRCGLAERILDITATGATLRDNNLVIVEEIFASTARFFANTCAFRTDERINSIARLLNGYVENRAFDPIAGRIDPTVGF